MPSSCRPPRSAWLLASLLVACVVSSATAQSTNIVLFGTTNTWRYNQTLSLDGTNWTARAYDDSTWPAGRGVLAREDSGNSFVTSRTNTVLNIGQTTYYFRTHFSFAHNKVGALLTFSNIVDDGAVFHLNGVEVARLYVTNGQPVGYGTYATNHEATGFDVFTLSGPLLESNLVNGDNVLAVEVHQTGPASDDVAFGLALSVSLSPLTLPPLKLPLTPASFGYSVVNAFPTIGGTQPFGGPICIASPPGETNRLFVVSQAGRIYVITNLANPNVTLFLDKLGQVHYNGEAGMLGLAFHPGYATNRLFFVSYSVDTTTAAGTGLHQRLSRFQASPVNPNLALANETILFTQKDPDENHNAGDLHFGPDGLLYVSTGDGGGANDQYKNSQVINSNLNSAILRLDVDQPFRADSLMPNPHPGITNGGAVNYRIPADNPFIGRTNFDGVAIDPATVRTEFYAVGFRNPWRMSFDPVTGWLYCGDVGQDAYEEVDIVVKGGNYGWNYREGRHAGPRTNAPQEALMEPIHEHPHGSGTLQGSSVIGGVVYRGTRFSQLYGAYVFGDYISQNIWILRYDGTNTVPFQRIFAGQPSMSAFGRDPANGDVLIANVSGGTIHRLIYNTNSSSGLAVPPTLAQTGAFTNMTSLTNQAQELTPSPGLIPYAINTPFWSDNARKSRWVVASAATPMSFSSEGMWGFPSGMAWVKHFDFEFTNGVPSSTRRIETRILVKNDGGTYGVSYRWGGSLTNAALVADEGFTENFIINSGGILRTQVWRYPSRSECQICHTRVGGHALGFNTLQLNCAYDYGNGPTNQLAAYAAAGCFNAPLPSLNTLRALAHATNAAASLEWRVRSYLAANCSQCHQPGGGGLGLWNANPSVPTSGAGLIQGALYNQFGNTNNRVIAPNSLSNSILLARISTRGPNQMPPLASSIVDSNGIQLLSEWITNGLAGYQSFTDWQTTHFGDTNLPAASASFDADGDGASNYDEYVAGTNPLLAGDVWRVDATHDLDQATLSFLPPAGLAYEIQWATNSATPVAWQFLDLPLNQPRYPATPTTVSFSEALTNAPFKMFRVKLSPP